MNTKNRIRPEIMELAKRENKLMLKDLKGLEVNRYEKKLLFNNLSNYTLISIAKYYMAICYSKLMPEDVPITRLEEMEKVILPLLLDRLEEISDKEDGKWEEILF